MFMLPIRVMGYHSNAGGFVIAAGVVLGICAGLLWTAHGSLIMAYPTGTWGSATLRVMNEQALKGRYRVDEGMVYFYMLGHL
jgi:hypothetical protein